LQILKGRYGPYITDGVVNATIGKDADPDDVTMDEAVSLLAEAAVRAKNKKPTAKKKTAKKKTTKKKTATKKTTTRKKAAAKKTVRKKAVKKVDPARVESGDDS